MPTGRCARFDHNHHHTPAWPALVLTAGIICGAITAAALHSAIADVAIVAVLTTGLVLVVALQHRHAEPEIPRLAIAAPARTQLPAGQRVQHVTQVVHVHAAAAPDRTEALTAEIAALRAQVAAQQSPAAIAPAAQHLHLYGVSPADVAELVARQSSHPALEERQS
jgi:hypothetical protein